MFAFKFLDYWLGIDFVSNKYHIINCDNVMPYDNIEIIGEMDTIDINPILQKKFNFLKFGGFKNVKKTGENYLKKIFGIIDFTSKVQYGKEDGKYLTIFRPLSFSSDHSFLIQTRTRLQHNVYAFANFTDKTYNGYNLLVCEEVFGKVHSKEFDIFSPFYSLNCFPNRWKKKINSPIRQVLDLTNKIVFSIDGDSTLDVDDAIHFEESPDGIELGVHIADVCSMYLGGISDKKFFLEKMGDNFSSIYLSEEKKIDMISRDVGENICSLKEGFEKNCISLILNFTKSFKMTSAKIHLSRIVNKHKMTYKNVDSILTSKAKHPIRTQLYGLQSLVSTFNHLEDVEYEKGEIISRNIVAKIMAMYNTIMASKLYKSHPKSILRVHYGQSGNLDLIENDDLREIVGRMNMYKGYYGISGELDECDVIHEGLGLQFYTHMTSPIRRFVDFWNQICLYEVLGEIKGDTSLIDIREMVTRINWKQMQIKKAYEQLSLVNIFHRKNCGELNDIYEGYLLKVSEDMISVYIPELDKKILKFEIGMEKLENILQMDVIDEEEIKWTRKDNGEYFVLKKFMKIRCKIVNRKNRFHWNGKIGIELVEPSFSDFLLN